MRDYKVRKKSAFFAYFFWFFFGFHYLYLGRIGIQLIYWLTIGGFGFWMLIDLFRIPRNNRAKVRQAIVAMVVTVTDWITLHVQSPVGDGRKLPVYGR